MELKNRRGDVIFTADGATTLEMLTAARASGADLSGANLRGADLRGADLYGADLRGADLYGADLRGANLRDAYLSGANLRDAYLSGANLRDAYLSGADLSGADLSGADLYGADLSGADLYGADLSGADLYGAKIDGKIIDRIVTVQTSAYRYLAYAGLFQDGSRYIRMGCLWKTLEEWDAVGIRQSNLSEFPDDGSEKSEARATLFEFLRAELLRMTPTEKKEHLV